MPEIRRDPDYLDDAPILEYLNNIGTNLATARPDARGEASFDYFFFAVRDPILNAFALPAGKRRSDLAHALALPGSQSFGCR